MITKFVFDSKKLEEANMIYFSIMKQIEIMEEEDKMFSEDNLWKLLSNKPRRMLNMLMIPYLL